MSGPLRDAFESLVGELRAHPDVKVRSAEIAEPLAAREVAKVLARAELALDEGVAALYREVGRVRIAWELTPARARALRESPRDPIGGRIEIIPLPELTGPMADWLYSEDTEPVAREQLARCKIFDVVNQDANRYAILPIERGVVRDRVMVYELEPGEIVDLGMSVAEYVALLRVSRGYSAVRSTSVRSNERAMERASRFVSGAFGVEVDLAVAKSIATRIERGLRAKLIADPALRLAMIEALLRRRAIDEAALGATLAGLEGESAFARAMDRLGELELEASALELVTVLDFDEGNDVYAAVGAALGEGGAERYSPRSLAGLGSFPRLRRLDLDGYGRRDEPLDLSPLRDHPALEELVLTGLCVGAAALDALPKLASLVLDDAALDESAVLDRLRARGVKVRVK